MMVDEFHVRSPEDGITRPLDEHYDGMRDVEQDAYGAWLAIQNLSAEVERLRAIITDAIPFIGYEAYVPDIKERAEKAVAYGEA